MSHRESYDQQGRTINVLIVNRSEIALRLLRTYALFPLHANDPRIRTFTVHTASEACAMHAVRADVSIQLEGEGPRAYLDKQSILAQAKAHNIQAISPGYGFLSEDADFAKMVEAHGMIWLGPTENQLQTLGDKMQARQLARSLGIPILQGTGMDVTKATTSEGAWEEVARFAESLPLGAQIMLKAANGGGGKGIRLVSPQFSSERIGKTELRAAYESCIRESSSSFGDSRVFAELYLTKAKHIEVQVIGDGKGAVTSLFERECSLQRNHQKLVEICPSPSISAKTRQGLTDAALKMAREVAYRSLGTFEFLVGPNGEFYFMETNPRIQVEHTVTEQVLGIDLAALQLQIGLGATLQNLGMDSAPPLPRTTSIQMRLNSEIVQPDGSVLPSSGKITSLHLPSGPNIRIDTAAHSILPGVGSYSPNPYFDSLLAKLIVTGPSFASALSLAERALKEVEIEGVKTNQSFLMALLDDDMVKLGKMFTTSIRDGYDQIFRKSKEIDEEMALLRSGREIEVSDKALVKESINRPDGAEVIELPIGGIVVSLKVKKGDKFNAGQELAVVEAMKMEHVVRANTEGTVDSVLASKGSIVQSGEILLFYIPSKGSDSTSNSEKFAEADIDLDEIRPELQAVLDRKSYLSDRSRSKAVLKRKALGYTTPREDLEALVDPDSFMELGDMVMAAQRSRYSDDHLARTTMGDGLITGIGLVNGFPVAVALGDYLVLAGTQGHFHHLKLDRIFSSVLSSPKPLIFYAEGGGGRPGDTDTPVVAGLNTPSFALLGEISARGIPIIAVANGYVFAGNAALLGVCDIVIATRGGKSDGGGKTSIGMGGPPMIEGGGLGKFRPEEVGPVSVHEKTGGIDVTVSSSSEATSLARTLVTFFNEPCFPTGKWSYSADPRVLRNSIPPVDERKRVYDVRKIINNLFDDGSFVELGRTWGHSIVTGIGRVEGKTLALLSSDPSSPLGGALDVPSALKALRLFRLLSRTKSFHILSLCDTPGFMVGPQFEKDAGGGGSFRVFGEWFAEAKRFERRGGRIFSIALRNAYGLGAQAMMGGSTLSNVFSVSWPSGSFGAMGLEGAVRLSMKKELAAIEDIKEREAAEKAMIEELRRRGEGINMSIMAEIDSTIDPADSRKWISLGLKSVGLRVPAFRLQSGVAPGSKL